jgi:dinuclear metal center YbgI/SA1388 family protein
MDLETLCARLDDLLSVEDYAAVDASANGLQVGTDGAVEHVAVAVDAAEATIDAAIEAGADLLVTHHGLVWGGLDRLTGQSYRRVAPLVENDLALYVAHLPLDGHQDIGNAAGLAELLDLSNRAPFGTVGEAYVGQRGQALEPYAIAELRELLETDLNTGGRPVRVLDFGPDELNSVAIVTGSGADFLDEAVAAGADVLVTGEGKGKLYHEAREAGISVVLAGHYATETFGVRSLAERIAEWGPATSSVDHPTGL